MESQSCLGRRLRSPEHLRSGLGGSNNHNILLFPNAHVRSPHCDILIPIGTMIFYAYHQFGHQTWEESGGPVDSVDSGSGESGSETTMTSDCQCDSSIHSLSSSEKARWPQPCLSSPPLKVITTDLFLTTALKNDKSCGKNAMKSFSHHTMIITKATHGQWRDI